MPTLLILSPLGCCSIGLICEVDVRYGRCRCIFEGLIFLAVKGVFVCKRHEYQARFGRKLVNPAAQAGAEITR